MKPTTLLFASLFSLFSATASFAQDTMIRDGIYTPGTQHSYKILKDVPVYWINAANEFNVYVDYKSPVLLTLKGQPGINLKELPAFVKVVVSDYSFMLCTADNNGYYFTPGGYEQKQTLELMKNFGDEIVKVEYGSDFTKHEVNTISLEQLKAAKSVYDVLGKE